jgi:hypothetical protein
VSKKDLRHHADVALAARVERGVVEQDVARGREALAGENLEQGRLATARLAHYTSAFLATMYQRALSSWYI